MTQAAVVPLSPDLAILLPDMPGTLQAFYATIYCVNGSEHRLMIWSHSRTAAGHRARELCTIYQWQAAHVDVR